MGTTAISAARFKLAYERPYIAHAVWALVPVEKTDMPETLAVDKYWRLYFHPKVEDKWTVDQIVAVLYHEVNHLLRDHMSRGEGKDKPRTWNIAGDAEINDDIRDEGCWQLPGEAVMPEKPPVNDDAGKMAEAYYAKILKDTKGKGVEPPPGVVIMGPSSGDCGSAAGGPGGDYEDPQPDDSNGGAGLSSTEGDMVRNQVAQEVADAAKSRGDVPGHLDRWAKEHIKEKVDWRKTLRTQLRNAVNHVSGASDYTWKKPSRRTQGDIIMPSTISPVANIACYIDTSGSMSKDMVQACIAEVGGILKAQNCMDGVKVICLDAKVQAVQKVFKKEQIQAKGGGGTDMRLCFQHADTLKPRPDIVIVLTDGETPWPDHKPNGYRSIVCLIPGAYQRSGPEWAKVIVVEDKE